MPVRNLDIVCSLVNVTIPPLARGEVSCPWALSGDVLLTGGQSLSSTSSISRPKSSLSSVFVSCMTDLGSLKSSSRPLVLCGSGAVSSESGCVVPNIEKAAYTALNSGFSRASSLKSGALLYSCA